MIGKRPKIKSFVAGATALAGIGFISLKESFTIGIGDSLSVLFAVIFGIQIVLIGKLVDKDSDIAGLTFFQMLTAALAGFAVCIVQGGLTFDIGKESVIGVVYLGVLNTFVAFMAQNYAQKYAKDTTAALIMSMESLFGFLLSVLYYREVITVKFLAGSVLCFAAVLMNTIEKGRKSG
jgi:drug/metabolite transporter (DMT)-like permease